MSNDKNDIDIDNLELATTNSRIKSFIIDDVLLTTITIIMLWQPISSVDGDFMSVVVIMNQAFLQIIFLKFLYQTFFIWHYGATLGKMVAKIRVIDYDNFGRVSLASAMMRAAMRIVSESIFYLGFFLAFFTESRQTLHDKFAKTLVVNG